MKTIKVRLDYPLERIKEPVVTHLVTDFDVAPNVLAADVDAGKGGWMLLGLSGDDAVINNALKWIESVGVRVTEQSA